jgi:multidrug efflux pump
MVKGGDVIELGHELSRETDAHRAALPVGVELAQVASMPRAVQRSINQFLRSLAEAVLIVLAVSLVSLGLRTGLVVAVSIPLVLAVTFLCMWLSTSACTRFRSARSSSRWACSSTTRSSRSR